MTKWFEGFSRRESRVLNISFLLMMICALLLSNERLLVRLTMPSARTLLDKIEFVVSEGDVRRSGDMVVVGSGGKVSVRVRPGAEFICSGESAFRMALIEGVLMVDLLGGEFVWTVNGEHEMAVRGERALVSGSPAVLNIRVGDGEPVVRTVSGRGLFQFKRALAGPVDGEAPVPAPMSNPVYFYVWHMSDFYSVAGQKVERRGAALVVPPVSLDVIVNWEHPEAHGPFSVQLASSSDFTGEKLFFNTTDQTFTLDRVFLGENHWRVSYSDLYWSDIRSFKVEPRFLELAFKRDGVSGGGVAAGVGSDVVLKWTPSELVSGYLVEVSVAENFAPERSSLQWLPVAELKTAFDQPGVRFARIRGVNARNEISDWSAPVKIVVR